MCRHYRPGEARPLLAIESLIVFSTKKNDNFDGRDLYHGFHGSHGKKRSSRSTLIKILDGLYHKTHKTKIARQKDENNFRFNNDGFIFVVVG